MKYIEIKARKAEISKEKALRLFPNQIQNIQQGFVINGNNHYIKVKNKLAPFSKLVDTFLDPPKENKIRNTKIGLIKIRRVPKNYAGTISYYFSNNVEIPYYVDNQNYKNHLITDVVNIVDAIKLVKDNKATIWYDVKYLLHKANLI